MDSAPRSVPPTSTTASGQVTSWIRSHALEVGLALFTVGFAISLPFIDTGNLTRFLFAASYLAVGRNPYAIFAYPPPAGLFAISLPTFGVFVLSGGSLAAANFFLKLVGLGALLAAGVFLRRLAVVLGASATAARRAQIALLTSGAIFFVTFIWVEQDIVGIAVTLGALWLLLREQSADRRPWVEVAALGLLAFAAFFYYFPIFLFPVVLFYAGNSSAQWRRAAASAVVLGAFFVGFLIVPGWDFVTNAGGTPGFSSPSPYSILTLLEPTLFRPSTLLETYVAWSLVGVLVIAELVVPYLLARARYPLVVAVACAMTLPFLLLNLSNGDEFVWPLPFFLLALVLLRPSLSRGPWLWLVEAYAIPMVVIANFFDSPGPGSGTGIFYFSYPQFHDAISIWTLVPDDVQVTQALAVALWLALAGLLLKVVRLARSPLTLPGATAPAAARVAPTETPLGWLRQWRHAKLPLVGAIVLVTFTVVSAAVPAPTLTVSSNSQFPVGYFLGYPVANGSVSYRFSSSGTELEVAPNLGSPSVLTEPWNNVSFARNVADETIAFDLAIEVEAPADYPYNTTVLGLGSSDLNVVAPFDAPAASSQLVPTAEQNVSAPTIDSPQFLSSPTGGLGFNGSSFAQYDVGGWATSGGTLTIYFHWSGAQYIQNLVAQVALGGVSYQLFGVGSEYLAGEITPNATAWTYSSPQLVKSFSWQELTLTASDDRVSLALDGLPISLPEPTYNATQGAGLTLGTAGPYPDQFQRYAFSGTMAGPYWTAGGAGLGAPESCAFADAPEATDVCAPLAASVNGSYSPSTGLSVTLGSTTALLTSSTTHLAVGRLDAVGPALGLTFLHLTIRADRSLVNLSGVIAGAIGVPTLLGVTLARWTRRRSDGASRT